MKKILPIFLFALLAACGGDDDPVADGGTSGAGAQQGADAAGGGDAAGGAQGGTSEGSSEGSSGDSGQVSGEGADGDDQEGNFILNAYQQNLGEIALAQMAVDQAEDENLRSYAQRMLAHHTYTNQRIAGFAQGMGLTLPTGPADDFAVRRQNMANLDGAAFDRAYINHSLAVHRQALTQFREQADVLETEQEDAGQGGGQTNGQTSGAGAGSTGQAGGAQQDADQAGGTDAGAGAAADSGSNSATGGNDTSADDDTNAGNDANAGDDANGAGVGLTQTRAFAVNTLPALQVHLLAAKALAGTLDQATFLTNLYQDGLAEIALSALALERAEDASVRAYAQRMIDDHTRANTQIAQLAQANGITLPAAPAPEQVAVRAELALMSGSDFDKAYMGHNVLAHEIAVIQAREQAEAGNGAGDDGGTGGGGGATAADGGPASGNGAANADAATQDDAEGSSDGTNGTSGNGGGTSGGTNGGAASGEIAALAATLLPDLEAHLESANDLYEGITPSLLFGAFENGMSEILLSQLALQRATGTEVQQYAQRMIDEHRDANARVIQLAEQNERELPSEPGPEAARAYIQLSQLADDEFERAFMERDVQLHQTALQLLEDGQASADGADVQAFVTETVPLLREQLAQAQTLLGQLPAPGDGASDGSTGGTDGSGSAGDAGDTSDAGAGAAASNAS